MGKLRDDKWAALAHRLNEGGCPVLLDDGYKVRPNGLTLVQIPSVGVSSVFDLDSGGTGCTVDVRIESQVDHCVKLDGSRFQFPPENIEFRLLPGPERGERAGNYCFPGSYLAFDEDIVINNIFAGKSKIRPRDRIEGLVLLVSEAPMPESWRHRKAVRMAMSLYRGRSKPFKFGCTICVDPDARWEISANPAVVAALIKSALIPGREWEFEQVRSTLHEHYQPMELIEARLADKIAAQLYRHAFAWKEKFEPLTDTTYLKIISKLTGPSDWPLLRAVRDLESLQSWRKAAHDRPGKAEKFSVRTETLQRQPSGRGNNGKIQQPTTTSPRAFLVSPK